MNAIAPMQGEHVYEASCRSFKEEDQISLLLNSYVSRSNNVEGRALNERMPNLSVLRNSLKCSQKHTRRNRKCKKRKINLVHVFQDKIRGKSSKQYRSIVFAEKYGLYVFKDSANSIDGRETREKQPTVQHKKRIAPSTSCR